MMTMQIIRVLIRAWYGKGEVRRGVGLTAGMEAVGLDVFGFETAREFESCEIVCCLGLAISGPRVVVFAILALHQ